MYTKADFISLREAARMVCVPYPTVARWIQQGLIRPRGYSHRQAIKVRLGSKEMQELWTLARLRGLLSLQQLRKAMKYLREELKHNPLSTGRFFVVGGPPLRRRLIKICDTGEAIELIGKNKGQLMIPLFFKES